jgi:hypothetical protein
VRNAKSVFAFLFLIIAGIASAAMSAFGLFAAAWGGTWAGSDIGDKVLHLLFWLLPTFSAVAFVGYFVSKRTALIGSWAITIASMIDIFIVNLNSCLAGDCTTKNPLKIASGVFLLPHIWILLASSLGLQLATSISDGDSARHSEREPTAVVN